MSQTIYFNGEIITMESQQPVEAVLAENGRICLVGSKEKVFDRADRKARRFDLQGKTLLPGLIDSHSHITALASSLGLISLKGGKSFEDIKQRVQSHMQQNPVPEGQWVMGFGYDHNALAEKKHPDKTLLDQISSDRPVLLVHASGHMGVASSLALKLLGIDRDTPDPEGGKIGRIAGSTEPDGYLEETAFTKIAADMPRPGPQQIGAQFKKAQQVYLQYGITTAQDGLTREKEWEMLLACAKGQELVLDVVSYLDLQSASHLAGEFPAHWKQYQNRLKIGGYKIFLDGSPQGRTAWMLEPYAGGEPGYCGYPVHTDEQVQALIRTALTQDAQLLAHCNGDAAAQQYICCFQKVLDEENGHTSTRPVMIHAQLVRDEQLRAMAALHMIASFFVDHTYDWGDVHIENFGFDRAKDISPAASAMDCGVVYTFHQDTPVMLPNMLKTLWCAVNRKTKKGLTLGEEQRISVYEALKAITINGAFQYGEEDQKGSIKAGKLADFVVLSQNPITAPKDQLKDIQVEATIKEDQVVYQRQ